MKKILFVVIALLAVLAGCMSTPEATEVEKNQIAKTELMAGFIEVFFFNDEVMEIKFFTLGGEKVTILSPENPIIEGPDGIQGLNVYLMIGTYEQQPIALIVEKLQGGWLLREVIVDLGDDGILNWKIKAPMPENLI